MLNLLNKVVTLNSIKKIEDNEYIYVTEDINRKSTLVSVEDVDMSEDKLNALRNETESYSAIMSLENNKIHVEILVEWLNSDYMDFGEMLVKGA